MYSPILPAVRPLHVPRAVRSCTRLFSACAACPASSPLFHLQAFSNSRESRWLAKGSGLSPVEHSTQLQLIRSSEGLDPHRTNNHKQPHPQQPALRGAKPSVGVKGPATNAVKAAASAPARRPVGSASGGNEGSKVRRRPRCSVGDKAAISVGRAVLARHATQRMTFKRKISRLERKNRRFYRRMQEMTVYVVLAIAAATAVGVWAFNREQKRSRREKGAPLPAEDQTKKLVADDRSSALSENDRRLAALYATPEIHDLLEWQRVLGMREAQEAQEVQNACEAALRAKRKSWWRRLFWS